MTKTVDNLPSPSSLGPFPQLSHPLLHPEGDGSAGGDATSPDPKGETGGGDLSEDDVLDVDGSPVKLADLLASHRARGEAEKLREFKDATVRAMDESLSKPERLAAARTWLRGMGVPAGEIESRAASVVGGETAPVGRSVKRSSSSGEEGERTMSDEVMTTIRQQSEELKRLRAREAERLLQSRVTDEVDNHPGLDNYFKRLVGVVGKEKAAKAYQVMQTRVREATEKQLHRKVQEVGRFDPEWIGDATKEALEQEYEALAAGIGGDVNIIGRTPDTDSEAAQLSRKPPAPAPQWTPKKPRGAVEGEVEAFIADSLIRASAEVGAGTESKV